MASKANTEPDSGVSSKPGPARGLMRSGGQVRFIHEGQQSYKTVDPRSRPKSAPVLPRRPATRSDVGPSAKKSVSQQTATRKAVSGGPQRVPANIKRPPALPLKSAMKKRVAFPPILVPAPIMPVTEQRLTVTPTSTPSPRSSSTTPMAKVAAMSWKSHVSRKRSFDLAFAPVEACPPIYDVARDPRRQPMSNPKVKLAFDRNERSVATPLDSFALSSSSNVRMKRAIDAAFAAPEVDLPIYDIRGLVPKAKATVAIDRSEKRTDVFSGHSTIKLPRITTFDADELQDKMLRLEYKLGSGCTPMEIFREACDQFDK